MLPDSTTKVPHYFLYCNLINSIQVFYALQSIASTEPMQWCCYILLHRHNNPKSRTFFSSNTWPTSQTKIWMYCISLNFASQFFFSIHKPNNKRSPNMYIHSWFHMLLSYAPYSHKATSKLQISLIFLANAMLKCPQHASKAYTKICIILRAK